MSRSHLLAALLPIAVAATAPAHAAEFREFDQAGFAAAQAQHRPILLDVHAWWCPVCASQNHTIKQTVTAPAYDKLVIFRIDYDKQKRVWQSFGVHKQATLIAFHGKQQVGRLDYVTDKDKIDALLATAVR